AARRRSGPYATGSAEKLFSAGCRLSSWRHGSSQGAFGEEAEEQPDRRPGDGLDAQGGHAEVPERDGGEAARDLVDARQHKAADEHDHEIAPDRYEQRAVAAQARREPAAQPDGVDGAGDRD